MTCSGFADPLAACETLLPAGHTEGQRHWIWLQSGVFAIKGFVIRAFWVLAACGFAAWRWSMGGELTDSMRVHQAIVWAMESGAFWGMQALVSTIEYPPLPTAALLFVRAILPVGLQDQAGLLVVTIGELWLAAYAIRAARVERSSRMIGLLTAVGLLATQYLLRGFSLDTGAVLMLPAASAAYHLYRWHVHRELRDFAVPAMNAGVLVLCGPVGMLAGISLVICLGSYGRKQPEWEDGYGALLLSPLLYAAALLPVANFLIVGRPFFFLARMLQRAHLPQSSVLPVLLLAVSVAILLFARRVLNVVGGSWLASIAAVSVLSGSVFAGQASALALPALILFACAVLQRDGSPASRTIATCGLVAACLLYRGGDPAASFAFDYPPAEEVTATIDQHWQDSRILLYDPRSAAIYAPELADRLVISMTFTPYWDLNRLKSEQLHMLIPPNDGRFYGQFDPLAKFHATGYKERLLFLEKQWPNGWQLWRCLRDKTDH